MLRTEQIGLAAVPKAVEVIERNARIQTQLISDLLDLSRIVAGTLHLRFELVDLARVIREAAESMKTVAEGRSIELETDCRSDGLVPGDADRLRQVVWNLLSNGIKFSESGGHVQVSLDGEAGMAVLTVRDDGCGIRPELLPVIFERFRQGDNSPTRAQSGLGIGLTIVKHLVEAHGGTVTAASAGEGRGSLFTVRLPARRADEMATAS
jgi:signal transduction histidine kinase